MHASLLPAIIQPRIQARAADMSEIPQMPDACDTPVGDRLAWPPAARAICRSVRYSQLEPWLAHRYLLRPWGAEMSNETKTVTEQARALPREHRFAP
jgi:hypothetical protein